MSAGAEVTNRMEDGASTGDSDADAALISIAISLKRIADAVGAAGSRQDLYNLVTDLAWHMGTAFERGRNQA